MKEIKAGNFFEFSCPEGSRVLLKEGTLFPENDSKFFVFELKDNFVKLGPLEGGKLQVDLPCSDGSHIKEELWVKAFQPMEMPEAHPALNPVKLEIPDLSGAIIVFLVLLIVAFFSFLYFKKEKEGGGNPQNVENLESLTPPEELKKFVKDCSIDQFFKEQDARSVHNFYDRAYKYLRAFLEFEFKLNTEFETTKEFLGTLRIVAKQRGLGERLESRIEALFEFADRVRFAAGRPRQEEQEKFFSEFKEVASKLQKGADT